MDRRVIVLAIDTVKSVLMGNPGASGVEVLAAMEGVLATFDRMTQEATCKNCGRPVSQFAGMDDWRHDDRDRSRGCRAASLGFDGEWDDSLKRGWTATPAV